MEAFPAMPKERTKACGINGTKPSMSNQSSHISAAPLPTELYMWGYIQEAYVSSLEFPIKKTKIRGMGLEL